MIKEVAIFEQLRTGYAYWRAYTLTVRELARLDRHILRDIGFEETSRRDIKACARAATIETLK